MISLNTTPSIGSTPLDIEVDDFPPAKTERNLAEGIKSLYQTCQMYDLNLVVGKTSLPAHKVVLASMSTACCEQVRKAVAEFEQGREPREALQSTEQVKTGPEAEAVVPLQATGEALAASPPVYSNQWKPDSPSEGEKAPAPERVSPNKDTSQEKSRPSSRPELVLDIASPEAARALLDMVYGLGREYNITSDEANKDVLRLAKQLDIPSLQELATRYLGEQLSSENAVARLQTCQEFGLDEMYDAIVEEVVMTRDALQLVAANEEVMKYPAILQGLLVRSANMHRPVRKRTKRELEESKAGKPEKIPKVSTSRVGGA